MDSVISWFQLKEHQRPHLILLYFSEPDHTGHEDGVDKDKMIESITKMDNLLGYLRQQLKTLDIYSQINLVITSDHGMTDVSTDRLIILDNYLSRMDDLYLNGRGAHIQLEHKKGKVRFNETRIY